MLKIAKIKNQFIVSGFKDISQNQNLIKVGFNNRIFKVFNTKIEAEEYLKRCEE